MKTTTVGGKVKISAEKDMLINVFDGSAEFNAGLKNQWTAPNTFIGDYEEIELLKKDITNNFKGQVTFKLLTPLPTFSGQDYNKTTKTFSNINRPYLPYGFDWYRQDWENLVNVKQQVVDLKISDFVTKIEVTGQQQRAIKKWYDITTDFKKFVFKIVHRIINEKEYLIEYSIYGKLQGKVLIDTSKNSLEEDSATRISVISGTGIYQIEELNLITSAKTGKIYKSNDSDLTNFNNFKNNLESYANLKTMKLLSSLEEMKKEFAPNYLYITLPGQGSSRTGSNTSKNSFKINNKEYLTPWFAALFNNADNEVSTNNEVSAGNEILMDINIDLANIANGKIKILTLTEDTGFISISGDIETPITEGDKGKVLNKKIKIKFLKPVSNHTIIEARFFDDTKSNDTSYLGEIVGLLNIYKNDIEYKLNVQYVDVNFKGKIDNIPCEMTLNTGLTKLSTLINFNNKSVRLTNPNVPNPTSGNGIVTINKTNILNSSTLESFVKSNIDLFKNTLNQSLIKPNISATSKILEIDFGNYDFNTPPSSTVNGLDQIKKSLIEYNEYNDFTFKVDSEGLIRGLINEYERINGRNERGILMFFIPFTILELNGLDYSAFKGRVDKVDYDSKYLILARSLLEENAKEVPAHEVGHSLGLYHPFEDFTIQNKHHFIKSETLNVMDYPNLGPDPINNPLPVPFDFGIYLYKYQWDIMIGDIKTPSQRGDLIKINTTDGTEII